MEGIKVAIVDLGEHLPIDLDYLTRKLNAQQPSFLFKHETSIPSQSLGKPDLEQQWYYIERLFDLLREHAQYSKVDYLVGVTHVRITRQTRDEGDIGNKDYFSLSDHRKVSIVSMNENVLAFNSPTKNAFQYAVFCIIGELLDNMAREHLCHPETEYCLFDDCADRTALAPGIEKSQICAPCTARLKEKGLADSQIDDAMRILKWCRRNTGMSSLLYRTVMNPLTTLAVGAAIGWASSAFIVREQYYTVVAAIVVAIGAVLMFYLLSDYKKRKFRR